MSLRFRLLIVSALNVCCISIVSRLERVIITSKESFDLTESVQSDEAGYVWTSVSNGRTYFTIALLSPGFDAWSQTLKLISVIHCPSWENIQSSGISIPGIRNVWISLSK